MKFLAFAAFCAIHVLPAAAQPSFIRATADRIEVMESTVRPALPVGPPNFSDRRYEDDYRFPISVVLHGVTFQRNGHKSETDVTYFINSQRAWLATSSEPCSVKKKSGESFAIYDFDNNTMLLLTPSRKTGMAMDLGAPCSSSSQAAVLASDEHWKCRRTGKRKIILTLSCDECICIDDVRHLRSDIWVTRDLHTDLAPIGVRTVFAPQLRAAQRSGGVLVEGKFYEGGALRSTLQMRNLNRNANLLVSPADYRMR